MRGERHHCSDEEPISSAEAIGWDRGSGARQSLPRIAASPPTYSSFRRIAKTSAAAAIPTIPPVNPRKKTEAKVEESESGPSTTSVVYAAIAAERAASVA